MSRNPRTSLEDHYTNSKSFFKSFKSKKSFGHLRSLSHNVSTDSLVSTASNTSTTATTSTSNLIKKITRPLSVYHINGVNNAETDDDKENRITNIKSLKSTISNPILNRTIEHASVPPRTQPRRLTNRNSTMFNNFLLAKITSRDDTNYPVRIHHQRSVSLSTAPTEISDQRTPTSIDIISDSIFDQSSIPFGDGDRNDSFSLSSTSTHSYIDPNHHPQQNDDSGLTSNESSIPHTDKLPKGIDQLIKRVNDKKQGGIDSDVDNDNDEFKSFNESITDQDSNELTSNISLIGNIMFFTSSVSKTTKQKPDFINSLEDIDYLDILTNETYTCFETDDPLCLKW